MKTKKFLILILLACSSCLFAQFGIKTGLNLANEIKSFNPADIVAGLSFKNLTGYQIGVVYQGMPQKTGLGFEVAALISQKGCAISDTSNTTGIIKQGYKEVNYIEVPLNFRYRVSMGFLGIYGVAGVYGGYELGGQTVDEINKSTNPDTFNSFMDHIDYGCNLGLGLELFRKIQLGLNWSQGLKNNSNTIVGLPTPINSLNRVYTVNLVYMF